MRITKVFNNSVVLCSDDAGREIVVFGRGVGFQKRPGAEVDPGLVEKQFVPGGTTSVGRLAEYLEELPPEDIDLAEHVLAEARTEFGPALSQHALFPLADHLSFAFRRIRDGIAMDYSLQWEVASLYPREYAFARRTVRTVSDLRGIALPELEAVPLALHFVNAQLGAGEMSETMKTTAALTAVLRSASNEAGVTIRDDSVDVARFATHVRFLVLRRMRGEVPPRVDEALGSAIRTANPVAYALAERVADELAQQFGWDVGPDERFYLTLHTSRFVPTEAGER